MSSLEFNKVAAAVLTAGVIAMGTGFLTDLLFHSQELEENAFPIAIGEAETEMAASGEPAAPETILPLLASADPASGEKLSKACAACHSFDEGGPNKVGPNLYGIVGKPIASTEGYAYSGTLEAMTGDSWTYEALDGYLANPRGWAPGTKMSYGGLKKVEQRADMVAWLRTLATDMVPLPEVAPEAPAAEGEAAASEATADEPAAATEGAAEAATQVAAATAGDSGLLQAIAAADPEAGAKAARKCAACHSFDQGGPNKIGPNLYGIVGQPVGGVDGFRYSKAAQAMHEAGTVWSYENLGAFLTAPKEWMKGTKMSYAGVKKETDLANLIAYMRQQSDNPPPLD